MASEWDLADSAGVSDDASDSSAATPLPPPTHGSLDVPALEEVTVPPSPPAHGDRDVQAEALLHARGYQTEMLEQSLKQNIIVAMDTGSGKTQVAILRMQKELEKAKPGKIIWFLTPTVALCIQQHEVISTQIPGVLTKALSGSKQPETWSTPEIWNAYLENVSIVVSTSQVLSDALLHNFVRMERLSLIVFDEAHNCAGNNPGSKVMENYRKAKAAGLITPAILGLTASPVMNASRNSLELIEKTLDAICKTPTIHRAELLAQVNRPEVVYISYEFASDIGTPACTQAMQSLQHVRNTMDIRHDPFVKQMLSENTERSRIKLKKAIKQQNTPSFQQMASLCRKSAELRKELGEWAADYFIHTVITRYLGSVVTSDTLHAAWTLAEKKFLAETLRRVQLPRQDTTATISVTEKAARLIEQLVKCPENTLGIIFVQETATVSVLQKLLSLHPSTRSLRVGTMVGISSHASRRGDIGDMELGDSLLNLESFRSGQLNFLIATNVLEEGIDVPACNLVICFDPPSSLKSFIQRRGRARMKKSKLILFCKPGQDAQSMWESLEGEMKKEYEAEDRIKGEFVALEDSTSDYTPTFSTSQGNAMDIDRAKGHLEHFCATLFSREFVDASPYYLLEKTYATQAESEPPQIRATVVLPNSLPPGLRRIKSAYVWYSEKTACKDAAFEAYKKLYEYGLVNEHLLPFRDSELVPGSDSRRSEEDVNERWNPWPRIARTWPGSVEYRQTVRLLDNGLELCRFSMSLPIPLPKIRPFNVYWNERPWTLKIDADSTRTIVSRHDAEETTALISLAFGHRHPELKAGGQHVVLFHSLLKDQKITIDQQGSRPLHSAANDAERLPYLVRNTINGTPYFYDAWLPSQPQDDLVQKKLPNYHLQAIETADTEGPWIALRKWPKRRTFLHKILKATHAKVASAKPHQTAWPASCCRLDSTPIINVQFGSLIPTITHMIEIYLVAQELSQTVLQELCFQDLSLLVTAISASSALEATNYQRLEFLGDVLLKLLTTISVAVERPHFPEGYLSRMRATIVSNARLCQSTKKAELDKFILAKAFTGRKWQPFYVDELAALEEQSGIRKMSTKVLADIIESLTGASYQDGGKGRPGMEKALQCLQILVPSVKWYGLEEGRHALLFLKETRNDLPPSLSSAEELLGYTFTNKALLLEALTHGSYSLGTSAERSYERLEFIGDAILDYVVVLELWEKNLPESMMSPLRAACVNADLLGFLGMEWCVPQETQDVVDGQPVQSVVSLPFWKFMRHSSSEIGFLQKVTQERHALERGPILDAVGNSSTYPWALLAHVHIPKIFSDIFESVLAAIWLDSGDVGECKALVRRIGILPYLDRMVDEGVDVIHPKSKLGELAGDKTVRYEVERENGAPAHLACKVFVDDELLVQVGDGLYKDEIITKAADTACGVLQGRQGVAVAADVMDTDM